MRSIENQPAIAECKATGVLTRLGSLFLRALLPVVVAAHVPHALAMTFSLVRSPCGGGNIKECAPRIVAQGHIVETDATALRQSFEIWKREGVGFSGITLHSPGGSVSGGLLLGREIRRLRLDVIAPVALTNFELGTDRIRREAPVISEIRCHSACVYAFAGGVRRQVDEGAILAVHQFAASSEMKNAVARSQSTVVLLRKYLEEMGVEAKLVDIASLVPAEQLRPLTRKEAMDLRLDNTTSPSSRWVIEALPDGTPHLEINKNLEAGRKVRVSLVRVNNIVYLVLALRFDPAIVDVHEIQETIRTDSPAVVLLLEGKRFSLEFFDSWERRSGEGRTVIFDATWLVPSALVENLASSRSFAIELGNSRPAREALGFNASVELGTENFAAGIKVLHRAR